MSQEAKTTHSGLPPCSQCCNAIRIELTAGATIKACALVGTLPLEPHPLDNTILLPAVKSCSGFKLSATPKGSTTAQA